MENAVELEKAYLENIYEVRSSGFGGWYDWGGERREEYRMTQIAVLHGGLPLHELGSRLGLEISVWKI